MSLIAYLESLLGQSSAVLALQAIMIPGTCEDPVILNLLSEIQLSRSTYKVTSYVDFALYMPSFKKFGTYLSNFIKDLNSPDIIKQFKEADTTWPVWSRSKIMIIPIITTVLNPIGVGFLNNTGEIKWSWIFEQHISAIHKCFFNAIDHMDYHLASMLLLTLKIC